LGWGFLLARSKRALVDSVKRNDLQHAMTSPDT